MEEPLTVHLPGGLGNQTRIPAETVVILNDDQTNGLELATEVVARLNRDDLVLLPMDDGYRTGMVEVDLSCLLPVKCGSAEDHPRNEFRVSGRDQACDQSAKARAHQEDRFADLLDVGETNLEALFELQHPTTIRDGDIFRAEVCREFVNLRTGRAGLETMEKNDREWMTHLLVFPLFCL